MACIALILLLFKGYRPIKRRMRNYAGEIDLIVKRGTTLVFVEVKARKEQIEERTISTQQQKRISDAASLYLSQNAMFADCDFRFDVVIIRPWKLPWHIPNAWEVA